MFNLFKAKTETSNEPLTKKAQCPYCSFQLEKMPSQKQKCKSCGKEFFVRTHYLTKEKVLLKDKDTALYDKEKEQYYKDKSLIDGLKLYINLDKVEFEKTLSKMEVTLRERFGQEPKLGDVAWGVANTLIAEAIQKNDLNLLSSIYFQMALYLYKTDRSYFTLMKTFYDIELTRYKKGDVVKQVEIRSIDESCTECKKLNGIVLSIDEALEKKVLPCTGCKDEENTIGIGWCRCQYLPIVVNLE